MNNARLRELERAQTGIAKKVLECVPIQEWWNQTQIVAQLSDRGSRPDFKIVSGCLRSLVESGLIRERQPGQYQRIKAKERPEKPAEEIVMPDNISRAPSKPTAVPAPDPVTSLGTIAQSLRNIANQIEEAALAIEQRQEGASEQLSKLKQLQTLLREI